MNPKRLLFESSLLVVLGIFLLSSSGFRDDRDDAKLSASELIHRHLASIASPDQLKARQAFAVQGDCVYRLLLGGVLDAPGTAQLVSKGRAYNILFNFGVGEYAGTQFVTDGKKTDIEYISGGQTNPLWVFLQGRDVLLIEGLLGGELTTAWALLDVDGRKPTLKYRGIENVDGRLLHRLDYQPRKGGWGLTVRLYFEPETYHHVRSTYEVVQPTGSSLVARPPWDRQSARQRVDERFDDFRDLDGLILPTIWTVTFFKSAHNGEPYGWSVPLAGMIPSPGVALGDPNRVPTGHGTVGPVLSSAGPEVGGSILLHWKTTITRSARNGEIPPETLASLLKID